MEKINQILLNNSLDKTTFREDSDAENDKENNSNLHVVCLGTGKGATTLLTGEPSSSFVIMLEEKPLLIVDLGFGVVQSYKKHIGEGECFENVYITHNHADHAAELPVMLCIVCGKQKMPKVFAAPEVMHRLQTQRLPEINSSSKLAELVEMKTCESGSRKTSVGDCGRFSISVLPSQHSETCYGFILYEHDKPLLGYTGDSGFNQSLYDQLFVAPNVILDARTNSSYEHAGFEDVNSYIQSRKSSKQQIFITGYGTLSEYPVDGIDGASQLIVGNKYSLINSNTELPTKDVCNSTRTSVTAEYILPSVA